MDPRAKDSFVPAPSETTLNTPSSGTAIGATSMPLPKNRPLHTAS
jgi:hypothetical protein